MLQTLDLIAMTETRNHLHQVLETLEMTVLRIKILIYIVVTPAMPVLAQETERLPGREGHKTTRAEVGKVGQMKDSRMADKGGPMNGSHMRACQGKNRKIGEGHAPSPIPELINTISPHTGQPPRIRKALKDVVDPPLAMQMTHERELGQMVEECVVHHVTDLAHSSPRRETPLVAAKGDQHSNVEKVATEHVPIPKDAKATLSTGAGLKIGKVLQPSQAEAPVETDQGFVHIVAGPSVRWQNATLLISTSFLTTHAKCAQPNYTTERVPITKWFRITGPPSLQLILQNFHPVQLTKAIDTCIHTKTSP